MIKDFSKNTPFAETNSPAPNKDTIAAIEEVELMKKDPSAFKGYADVDEMTDELLSESAV